QCAYRPFDFRFILWHPLMVDWPRRELAAALEIPNNICLIARRQSPANLDYHYFWSTTEIPIDGLLRNDNRGNETCFPLYTATAHSRSCNVNEKFIHHAQQTWKSNDVEQEFLFHVIYAVFHCSQYRTLFKHDLPEQFPRFFFPLKKSLATQLAIQGFKLRQLHATEQNQSHLPEPHPPDDWSKPRFSQGKLSFSKSVSRSLKTTTWAFQVGSHRVLEKYTKHRFKDEYFNGLVSDCDRMIRKIENHQEIVQQLDRIIESQGGFLEAFDFGRRTYDHSA
ncbi:MAG: type ISP restriction/modification enzyme, partial [Planctomycetota bacterium]|nr:type ISP restriction/modification enzyme [Planctomycetota bacterium]